MTFRNAVLSTPTETRTTNGMAAYKSTMNKNVDLFFKIGASRGKNITKEFMAAYLENSEIALRVAQWARDVRGGAGERALFRQILIYVEQNFKADLLNTNLLKNIPEIGRWDDLLIFTDPEVKAKAYDLIAEALNAGNGLCAKWMPRKGPVAVELRNALGLTPKQYRRILVDLTKVVETQMCSKNWEEINFSHVPSLAMSRYSKAFGRNAAESFAKYKESLQKGEAGVKVNAGAVYPYDILKNVRHGDAALADEQWKALPNYIGDSKVLPLVDVSGSMSCPVHGMTGMTCMHMAISLGLYLSDKNTGDFKDMFLTFSERPEFVTVSGTLSQKYDQMQSSSWGYNTNLEAAFKKILSVAKTNQVSQADMPQTLLILSDMQFDSACRNTDNRAIEMIKDQYIAAGYEMPNVVFWNLNAHDNVPVKFDERGTALVSGFSPSIMKAVLAADFDEMTPEGIMLKAVNIEKYDL